MLNGNALVQDVVFLDKYARWNEAEQRRETWDETANRVVEFFKTHTPWFKMPPKVQEELEEGIHGRNVLPAMRIVQMAGPALERCHVGAYNCCYCPIESVKDFGDILYILMQGTGVGFSVEARHVDKLPELNPYERTFPGRVFLVKDSTESWCDSVIELLKHEYANQELEFDYQLIRPKGARLKTKGGVASGPQPLMDLHAFIKNVFKEAREHYDVRLRPIDVYDIVCMIGQIVEVGGVRRAALMCLCDLSDEDMRHAKEGEFWKDTPQRTRSNNSAVYNTLEVPIEFGEEFKALRESGTGERGIFNRRIAQEKYEKDVLYGTNPCFAAGTLIPTKNGTFPIEQLVGKTVEVWDGTEWRTCDNFRVTGENQPLLRFELQDGSELRVTPAHSMILEDGRRIAASEVTVGDSLCLSNIPLTHGTTKINAAYLKGFLVGDGSWDGAKPMLAVYPPKYVCADALVNATGELVASAPRTNAIHTVDMVADGTQERKRLRGLSRYQAELAPWVTSAKVALPRELFVADAASKCQFLAGLFDADGTALDTENGFGYQLASISPTLLKDVQALLKTLGVRSKVSLSKEAGETTFPDGRTYATQPLYRLSIGQAGAVLLSQQVQFLRLKSFAHRELRYDVKPRMGKVVAIEEAGIAEKVYCCTIPVTHAIAIGNGIITGQCSEIILRPRQFCNLSIAVARKGDTHEVLAKKVKLATWLGTLQATLTSFTYISEKFKENCEEERLLGVDITGQLDNEIFAGIFHSGNDPEDIFWDLQDIAKVVNSVAANEFGINPARAITTVKPSGNSSQFLDCASGLHPRYAPFYIRRLRLGANSPVAQVLQHVGIKGEAAIEDPGTLVFGFPIKSPSGAVTRDQSSALMQLEYWRHNAGYTHHTPSCTIYVKDYEWDAVEKWVRENFKIVGGMSFLPYHGGVYKQAPYEEIDEITYNRMSEALPKSIDWPTLLHKFEASDMTTGAQELACLGGVCDI